NEEVLLHAQFNEAIDLLHDAAYRGMRLSLANLSLILKKYQQHGLYKNENDAVFLYEYIKKIFVNDKNSKEMDELHRRMIVFYVRHHFYFNMQNKDNVANKVESIFQNHKNNETFAGLIRAYEEIGEYHKAWKRYQEEGGSYRSDH